MSHLADHFKAERLKRGLTLEQLALLTDHPDTRKTAGRIARFEADGAINEDLLVLVAEALGIGLPVVEELIEKDRGARP
jgi:transcriptional regulator with XRE-family HTH domain